MNLRSFMFSSCLCGALFVSVVNNNKIPEGHGEEIETLVNGRKSTGDYKLIWRAEGLPGGIYVCRLRIGDVVRTKKIALQKKSRFVIQIHKDQGGSHETEQT